MLPAIDSMDIHEYENRCKDAQTQPSLPSAVEMAAVRRVTKRMLLYVRCYVLATLVGLGIIEAYNRRDTPIVTLLFAGGLCLSELQAWRENARLRAMLEWYALCKPEDLIAALKSRWDQHPFERKAISEIFAEYFPEKTNPFVPKEIP